jgi:regulator of sigma E protease
MLDFLLNNDLLSALFAFALVLIPAVLIHELGHFLAAKAVGIAILEFGIGFPPRLAKLFRWGETDFTLNWLPLGGFVRPLGEDMVKPISQDVVERERRQLYSEMEKSKSTPRLIAEDGEVIEITDEPLVNTPPEIKTEGIQPRRLRAVSEAKPLGRIFFMAAGALANFVSAFVIFVLIGMLGVPTIVGGRVAVIGVDNTGPLARAGLQPDDYIENINGQNFVDSRHFFDLLRTYDGEQITLAVRRPETDDPLEVIFTPEFSGDRNVRIFVRVMGVVEDAPAAQAGMLPADLIVAFNGEPIATVERLQELTQQHLGDEVIITLLTEGEQRDISLVPRANPPEGEGAMGIVIQAAFHDLVTGVVYQEGPLQQVVVSQPFGEAVRYSTDRIAWVVRNIIRVPSELLRGTISPEAARPVSIVGISQMGGELLQDSIEQGQPVIILNYIALISVALGLTNLLPIPALDGGRILFVLIEIVRGRPVAPEREGLVHLIGLVLLLSVTVVFILNDLSNPITFIR